MLTEMFGEKLEQPFVCNNTVIYHLENNVVLLNHEP